MNNGCLWMQLRIEEILREACVPSGVEPVGAACGRCSPDGGEVCLHAPASIRSASNPRTCKPVPIACDGKKRRKRFPVRFIRDRPALRR